MSATKHRALVVEDDPGTQQLISSILTKGDYCCHSTDSGAGAYNALEQEDFDLLLIDRKLPDTDGVRLLRQLRARDISAPAIIITAYPSVPSAVDALQLSAYDYLEKPFNTSELLQKANRALQALRLLDENAYLWHALADKYGWQHVMSRDPQTQHSYIVAAQAAGSTTPVLIEGETGTGKEYLARAIHYMSDRADHTFVAINCGGFPSELLESELFGHVRGAFTSAFSQKAGLCEVAHKGTLFLDEITEMSPAMQVKLLRFTEDHTFTRLGSTHPREVDVRIIAASNKPLTPVMEAGEFRQDLYYRLNVVPLYLPPLRERPEDVELFAQHFVAQSAPGGRKTISSQAWEKMKRYQWPGNLRELRNVIQRAVLLAVGDTLEDKHLLLEPTSGSLADYYFGPVTKTTVSGPAPQREEEEVALLSLEDVEKRHIRGVYVACDGNKSRAAEILGISRSTLNRRLTQYEESNR